MYYYNNIVYIIPSDDGDLHIIIVCYIRGIDVTVYNNEYIYTVCV